MGEKQGMKYVAEGNVYGKTWGETTFFFRKTLKIYNWTKGCPQASGGK